MRVLQIGNFKPPHSTENHLKRALENNGHEVSAVQEDDFRIWEALALDPSLAWDVKPDFILWTRTGWDYTHALHGAYRSPIEAFSFQLMFLNRALKQGIPTVAYHLDLFFGLNPSRVAVLDEPFFSCNLVCTADGGHQDEFEAKGINHVWFPPAVSRDECEPGMFRDEFHSPIAFVGSWQGGYHRESKHRHELVAWLQEHYARDCAFWPKPGHPAIRGSDLRDLYASVDVVIGDSCFAGGVPDYWSDRIPETIGRGGFLLHPWVPGLSDQFPHPGLPWTWGAGDWGELKSLIDSALALNPAARRGLAAQGRLHVLQTATYEVRMAQLVKDLQMLGRLPSPPAPKAKTPRKKS